MASDSPLADALRAAIENRKDPVWVFDADAESMLFGNAAACDFWRADSVEALVSRDYATDMSVATRSRLAAVRAALENGEVVHEQWTFYPGAQTPKTVELRAERADLTDGRVAILFSIERAGQTPKDALRGVEAVRHTSVLITLFDRDGTRSLFANPASLRSYGAGQAWRSLWVSRFVDEDEGERVLKEVQDGQTVSLETRMRTRGGPRWHGLDARLTVDPVTGDPAILVNEKDVHQAKEAEAGLRTVREELEHRVLLRTSELAASRDFVDTVLKTLDALVLVIDDKGSVQWANPTASARLGEDIEGRTASSVDGLPRDGEPREVVLHTEHGETLLHWTTAPLLGSCDFTVMTGVDVSEQRALQSQMQVNDRLASLGTLAAGIAHELNNPFAVIRANLEVMRDDLAEGGPAESLQASVTDSLASMERASRIVADLRAYTRVEEDAQPVELKGLVDGAVGLAAGPLRDLTVEVQVPAGLHVRAVDSLLTQVLLNLLMNAAQSVDGPPGRVCVTATQHGEQVHITVEDDGPGVDAELARRAFDPFFTTKRVGEGTGLGLYVCQRIVRGLGGDIRFDANVESGARVEVTLPFALPRRTSQTRVVRADRGESKRVLVVDDDPAVLRAMKRLLRGHVVDLASSGEQALVLLQEAAGTHLGGEASYDMVLCDLMMPGMSGDTLFEAVRDKHPSAAPRFVFMSGGLPYRSSIGEFIGSVPNPFLQKPVDRRALDDALAEVCAPAAD